MPLVACFWLFFSQWWPFSPNSIVKIENELSTTTVNDVAPHKRIVALQTTKLKVSSFTYGRRIYKDLQTWHRKTPMLNTKPNDYCITHVLLSLCNKTIYSKIAACVSLLYLMYPLFFFTLATVFQLITKQALGKTWKEVYIWQKLRRWVVCIGDYRGQIIQRYDWRWHLSIALSSRYYTQVN